MGSYSDVSIDGFSIWSSKSYVDDASLSIFHERDRRERVAVRPRYSGHTPDEVLEYALSAHEMRERLDAMGFTVSQAKADYAAGLRSEAEDYLSGGYTQAQQRAVKEWTFERWSAAVARLAPHGFQMWNADRFADDPDAKRIANDGNYGLGAHFSDMRLMLRALLEALTAAQEVVLDVTDLMGYYEEDEAICADARRNWAIENSIYGPIILLTEGKSDTRILKATFEVMAPHLAGLYGFLDFDGLRLEGGVDLLAKTVRAFVGAGISARMIGIFDHDTAGAAALASLTNITLPLHMKVMALPECEIAKDYPTLGPQGLAQMDVNGLACGIEMYLGAEALRNETGEFRPVRWTGYVAKLGRYQGAVEGKDEIADAFLASLRSCPDGTVARTRFPDMAKVIDMITSAFSETLPIGRGPRERLSDG